MPAATETTFTLKRLSPEAVQSALDKAERYRLLNEPRQAESISRDVLAVDPESQEALKVLLLSLTDQLATGRRACVEEARATMKRLSSEYERAYYDGVINERQGKAILDRNNVGGGATAYGWLEKAMEAYELAQGIQPPGNEDALLRWNTCARMIMEDSSIRPDVEDASNLMLE